MDFVPYGADAGVANLDQDNEHEGDEQEERAEESPYEACPGGSFYLVLGRVEFVVDQGLGGLFLAAEHLGGNQWVAWYDVRAQRCEVG